MMVIWSATFEISFSLCEMMNRRHALLLEVEQQVEQLFAVALVQRRRRLVEDEQDLTFLASALAISISLLLADAEVGDERLGVLVQPDEGEELARAREGAVPVDDAEAGRLVAEEHVLGDRQERHQRQFLVDDDDAEMLALG